MARSLLEQFEAVKQTVEEHGKFTDSPVERVEELGIQMFASPMLPNILLGAALTASIQRAVGMVPLVFVIVTWVAWVIAVVVFALGDEIIYAYQASKKTFDDDEPWGIE